MVGAVVQVQNQAGPHKDKWDLSGTVVVVLPHDAYHVKMDGSGRVTKRNQRFLRPIVPYSSLLKGPGADTSVKDIDLRSSCTDDYMGHDDLTDSYPGSGDDGASLPGAGAPGGSGLDGPLPGERARRGVAARTSPYRGLAAPRLQ